MPYQYFEVLTSRTAKRLIAAVWCFSVAWSSLSIFTWRDIDHHLSIPQNTTTIYSTSHIPQILQNGAKRSVFSIRVDRMCRNTNIYHSLVSFYGIYIPVLICMTGVYLRILHIAVRQIKKIKKQESIQGSTRYRTTTIMSLISTNEDIDSSKSSKNASLFKCYGRSIDKELQATKSVAVVYLAFCICWLPTCIITTIIHSDEHYFRHLQERDMTLFLIIYYLFVEILPLLNFMINPLIYSFFNAQFRTGVLQLKRKFIRRAQHSERLFEFSLRERAMTYQ